MISKQDFVEHMLHINISNDALRHLIKFAGIDLYDSPLFSWMNESADLVFSIFNAHNKISEEERDDFFSEFWDIADVMTYDEAKNRLAWDEFYDKWS